MASAQLSYGIGVQNRYAAFLDDATDDQLAYNRQKIANQNKSNKFTHHKQVNQQQGSKNKFSGMKDNSKNVNLNKQDVNIQKKPNVGQRKQQQNSVGSPSSSTVGNKKVINSVQSRLAGPKEVVQIKPKDQALSQTNQVGQHQQKQRHVKHDKNLPVVKEVSSSNGNTDNSPLGGPQGQQNQNNSRPQRKNQDSKSSDDRPQIASSQDNFNVRPKTGNYSRPYGRGVGRGRGGVRSGESERNLDGKRQFDRLSGSKYKVGEKKSGGGAHNWGKQEDINALTTPLRSENTHANESEKTVNINTTNNSAAPAAPTNSRPSFRGSGRGRSQGSRGGGRSGGQRSSDNNSANHQQPPEKPKSIPNFSDAQDFPSLAP